MDYERALVGMARAKPSTKSEVARSSKCTDWCAPKVLDTAGIVRDAIFQQQPFRDTANSSIASCSSKIGWARASRENRVVFKAET